MSARGTGRVSAVVLTLLAVVTLAGLLPLPAALVERGYSRTVYPVVTRLLVPASAAAPAPLTPALLAALLVGAGVGLARLLRPGGRRGGGRLLAALLLATGAWFYLGWGLNYRREPVEVLLELPSEAVSREELRALAAALAAVIATDGATPADPEAALRSVALRLGDLVREVTGAEPTLPRGVKYLPAGTLLTFGNAGVISPWLLEANVDAGLPPAARVAVGAHELAHLAGFAREADADLLGVLAGLGAGHGYARYAVALGAFDHVAGQLGGDERRRLLAALPERARDDLAERARTLRRYYRPGPANALGRVYDRYLRSQGVGAGVADYDRTATLLARAARRGMPDGGDR